MRKRVVEILNQINDTNESFSQLDTLALLEKTIITISQHSDYDLFDYRDLLPIQLENLINKFEDMSNNGEVDYKDCKELQLKLKSFGYTFEYGLDAIPYDLKRI